MQLVRLLSLAAAFMLMLAGGAAFAHEDHEDLGAGPGPSEEQVEAQGGSRKAAVSAHEGMAEAHEMATEEHEQAADENKTFSERLVSWLGRLHTLAIHFPIAMFVGALGVELVGLWRRDPSLRTAVHVMVRGRLLSDGPKSSADAAPVARHGHRPGRAGPALPLGRGPPQPRKRQAILLDPAGRNDHCHRRAGIHRRKLHARRHGSSRLLNAEKK
jgi:hypothetical protein